MSRQVWKNNKKHTVKHIGNICSVALYSTHDTVQALHLEGTVLALTYHNKPTKNSMAILEV